MMLMLLQTQFEQHPRTGDISQLVQLQMPPSLLASESVTSEVGLHDPSAMRLDARAWLPSEVRSVTWKRKYLLW